MNIKAGDIIKIRRSTGDFVVLGPHTLDAAYIVAVQLQTPRYHISRYALSKVTHVNGELYKKPLNITEDDVGKRIQYRNGTFSILLGFSPHASEERYTILSGYGKGHYPDGREHNTDGCTDYDIIEVLD